MKKECIQFYKVSNLAIFASLSQIVFEKTHLFHIRASNQYMHKAQIKFIYLDPASCIKSFGISAFIRLVLL